MSTFVLDGQQIPFEKGDTIIRAAHRQGIEIPHYCWHEGLSVAANCRMCLVEVKSDRPMMMPILQWDEKKKAYSPASKVKLVPACQTPVSEGMEVFTKNENVLRTQAAVQEFLLLDHPVDCPICDQAGECKLQDYWESGHGKLKRKRTEPVHKPKAVSFGPTITYDAERCITCTRCVRFCEEVVGDHVLDERERGNKTEIVASPGRQLDHGYTLMTAHLCPVGALTAKHFRFKNRVWLMRTAPSICPGCATGCNCLIDYDPRTDKVYRLRPRTNMAVNKYWMCDDGMMSYTRIHEGRIEGASIRNNGGSTDRATALEAAAKALADWSGDKTAVVLSAEHCSEDNLALVKLAKDVLGGARMYLAARAGWQGDQILRHADNNPNRAGAVQAAGVELGTTQELVGAVSEGNVKAVVALGSGCQETAEELAGLKKLAVLLCLASNRGPLADVASIVIPVACHAEMDGTFVNAQGMAQRFSRAISPPQDVTSAWETIVDLARARDKDLGFTRLVDLQKDMPSPAAAGAAAQGSSA